MQRFVILATLVLLAGCQSVDGTYRPGCVAFEGDEVSLSGGSFVWDRFTDQVAVDEDGAVVDPFPDYPRRGSFRLDGNRLELAFADGSAAQTLFLVQEKGGRLRLLTNEQRAAYERSGRVPECALSRDAPAGA